MAFPLKGIDRSAAHVLRAAGTTDHCRNMRPMPPRANRFGGGKRGGWGKLFTNQMVGLNSSTQINHLVIVPKVTDAPPSSAGLTAVTIVDDFSTRLARDKAATTVYHSSNLAYIDSADSSKSRYDLAMFRRDYLGGGEHKVSSTFDYGVQKTDLSLTGGDTLTDAMDGGLVIDWYDNAAGGYPGITVLYNCLNDVTIQMYASGTADNTAGNGAGAIGESIGFGPFIQGSALLNQYIGACLSYVAANQVRLEIIKVNNGTRTVLSYSRTITLDTTAWLTDPTDTDPDLFIRIWESGGVIGAQCSWGSQDIGATSGGGGGGSRTINNAFGTGTSGSGDGDGTYLSCSTTDSTFTGNTRVGAAALFTAGGAPADVDNRWYVRAIKYTKLVPTPPVVVTDGMCVFNSTLSYNTSAKYIVPLSPVEAVSVHKGTGAVSNRSNWYAVDDSLSGITHPYVAPLDPQTVNGNTASNYSSYIILGSYRSVEVAGRINARNVDSGTDSEDICGAAFRITTDYKNGILVEVKHGAGAPSSSYYFGCTHQHSYTEIKFVGLCNGERFVLETYSISNMHMAPFRAEVRQRWRDSGGLVSAMTIKWQMNGMTLKTFTPSSMSGYAAWIARFGTLGIGTKITAASGVGMDTSSTTGLAFPGDHAGAPNSYAWGGFPVDTTIEDAGSQIVAEFDSQVYAWLSGYIYTGPSSGGTASTIPGGDGAGPRNTLVQHAIIGNLLFMTDGDVTLYTSVNRTGNGVIVGTVDLYGASSYLSPKNCRLCGSFLGRLVLARPDNDPTFVAFSASDYGLDADAVAPPLDWDYGRDPAESSAIAFAAPEAVTAIIPGPNDTLFVGGPSRISMFVGDPGINGQVLLRTAKTGIVGPRAWCYDDHNNLYFIGGAGGLWVLPAGGGDPVNVDRGRWGEAISEIDASSYFIQLQFNPVEREITIFVTPTTHTTGAVHYVYSVPFDACFEDTIDAAGEYMNPWATAQGDSSTASQRQIIIGGRDGYVRRYNSAIAYDEATAGTQTAIPCSVDLYPEMPLSQNVETMAVQVQATLAEDSGAVTGYWFSDESMAAVAALTTGSQTATVTLAAGYNTPSSIRSRGAAHKFRLYQSSATLTMTLEEVQASFSPRGRRR